MAKINCKQDTCYVGNKHHRPHAQAIAASWVDFDVLGLEVKYGFGSRWGFFHGVPVAMIACRDPLDLTNTKPPPFRHEIKCQRLAQHTRAVTKKHKSGCTNTILCFIQLAHIIIQKLLKIKKVGYNVFTG
jgi:hypothetical protein